MGLENIEVTRTQKQKHCMFSCTCESQHLMCILDYECGVDCETRTETRKKEREKYRGSVRTRACDLKSEKGAGKKRWEGKGVGEKR